MVTSDPSAVRVRLTAARGAGGGGSGLGLGWGLAVRDAAGRAVAEDRPAGLAGTVEAVGELHAATTQSTASATAILRIIHSRCLVPAHTIRSP